MSKEPLVSIIIPSYNTARYVREAVDSALAQTYKNIEIIAVDDGSTDNTKDIVANYLKDKRVNYVYQKNGGLAAARNTGIKASRGEYIALLDADDVYLPKKITEQVAHLETNKACDISYCDLYHFWDEEPGKLLKLNYAYYSGQDVLPHLLEKNFIAPLSVVMRRTALERFGYFEESLRRSEDLEFWLRLAYAGANFCFLPKVLGKLRMRRTQNLQGIESQPQVKLTMLQVLENLNKKMNPEDREKFKMKHHIFIYRMRLGMAYLLVEKKEDAKKFIMEGLADYPLGLILGKIIWFPFSFLPASLIRGIILSIYNFSRSWLLAEI